MNQKINQIISIIRHNRLFWTGAGSAATLAMLALIIFFISHSPIPLRLTPANVGSQSAAMVFMTYQPTKTCMYLYQSKLFLKGKWVCDKSSTTHILTAENLAPQTTYHAIIKSGWKFYKKTVPHIQTKPLSETAPALPEPAYGTVKNQQNQPVVDALVVVFPDQNVSQGVVAKTNVQGNFAVDISQFSGEYQTITVDASTVEGLWDNQTFPKNIHSPFNQLTVKPFVIND